MLIIVSVISGELKVFSINAVTILSLGAVAYLIVFGSLIAFSSYIWLLKVSTPARVSTYAFVNPLIALMLGWMFAGEALNARILIASLLTVVAVALIVGGKYWQGKAKPPSTSPELEV
jgi:drug/metabolite transporter (DMT)-like permease